MISPLGGYSVVGRPRLPHQLVCGVKRLIANLIILQLGGISTRKRPDWRPLPQPLQILNEPALGAIVTVSTSIGGRDYRAAYGLRSIASSGPRR
jgi:hypothetical protein